MSAHPRGHRSHVPKGGGAQRYAARKKDKLVAQAKRLEADIVSRQETSEGTKAEVAHVQDAEPTRIMWPDGRGVATGANEPAHADPVAQEIERLTKEAHEACPCKIYADTIDGDACDARPCDCFVVDGKGNIHCQWPGHVAIDALASLARRLAAENVALTTCGCGKRLSKPLCGVCDNDD